MNHKLLIFIAGGALAACTATAATDTYTVSAEFSEDFDGQPAVMINFDTGEKIDSVLVEGNKAVFSGSVEKPVMARIIIDGNRVPVFVLEPGAITISPEVRGASGSALNDLNAKIQQHIGELGAKYQAAPRIAQVMPSGSALWRRMTHIAIPCSRPMWITLSDIPCSWTKPII